MSHLHFSRAGKPGKPYPEFLSDGALAKYLVPKDDLYAERTLRPNAEATTVEDLCSGSIDPFEVCFGCRAWEKASAP